VRGACSGAGPCLAPKIDFHIIEYAIRINDQFPVCFVCKDDGPHDVEIVDYH
jgi:hypothetical protein